jgi:hypothetical protein
MPLGTVLGEFDDRVSSVKVRDLSGGQRCIEIDSTGEAKGQGPDQIFGTVSIEGMAGRSVTYKVTGTILTISGAVIRYSGRGVGTLSGTRRTVRSWDFRVRLRKKYRKILASLPSTTG